MRKKELNDGHYLEITDRLHVVNVMIDEILLEHPVTDFYPELKKLIEEASKNLGDAYQYSGKLLYNDKNG